MKNILSFNENGKQVWIIGRVKKLSLPIVNMAMNLVALDFIKVPITNMNHETAIGVQILYSLTHKYINFF